MSLKELAKSKPWLVAAIILLVLAVLAGCSKYIAPREPPEIKEWVIKGGVYVLAICEDKVVCYSTEDLPPRKMSCIRDFTLANKYCGIEEEQVNANCVNCAWIKSGGE